jgi:hypothetical protein
MLVAGTALLTLANSGAANASLSSVSQGVWEGGNNKWIANFASETGAKISIVSDYLGYGTGWGDWGGPGSPPSQLSQYQGTSYQLVIGLPINPGVGASSTVLANGAAGLYDSYYVTLAKNAVALGESNIIWRPGWEFYGSWYDWKVTNTTDATNYAAYFRHIVTAMRSVPGQSFRFVWEGADPSVGSYPGAYTATQAYPGDAYVDYVGLDFYDQSWVGGCGIPYNGTTWTATQSSCVWANDQSQTLGVLSSFASAHAKPIVLPEWGVIYRADGHGGGDDPTYINNITTWMGSHNVAWVSYFDYYTGGPHSDLDSALGDYPNSLAAYRQALSSTATATTTTTSPATTTTTSPSSSPVTTTTVPTARHHRHHGSATVGVIPKLGSAFLLVATATSSAVINRHAWRTR